MSKVIQGDTGESYIARRQAEGVTYEEALAEWRQHTDVDQGREANSKLTGNPAMDDGSASGEKPATDAPPATDGGADTQAGGETTNG